MSALEQRFRREIERAHAARDEARAAAERAAPGSPERADALYGDERTVDFEAGIVYESGETGVLKRTLTVMDTGA